MTPVSHLQTFRQRLFPEEFRISEAYPEDARTLLTRGIGNLIRDWTQPVVPPPQQNSQRLHFLADVATGLWRMRRNMVPAASPRLMEARPLNKDMAKAFRWLVSIWDVLKENGIEIQDHTGDSYRSGQSIKVPAFEPTPGLTEETVIDTIRPSIYIDGKMVQMGEVVVGVPEIIQPTASSNK